jgi:hypothetical protein
VRHILVYTIYRNTESTVFPFSSFTLLLNLYTYPVVDNKWLFFLLHNLEKNWIWLARAYVYWGFGSPILVMPIRAGIYLHRNTVITICVEFVTVWIMTKLATCRLATYLYYYISFIITLFLISLLLRNVWWWRTYNWLDILVEKQLHCDIFRCYLIIVLGLCISFVPTFFIPIRSPRYIYSLKINILRVWKKKKKRFLIIFMVYQRGNKKQFIIGRKSQYYSDQSKFKRFVPFICMLKC